MQLNFIMVLIYILNKSIRICFFLWPSGLEHGSIRFFEELQGSLHFSFSQCYWSWECLNHIKFHHINNQATKCWVELFVGLSVNRHTWEIGILNVVTEVQQLNDKWKTGLPSSKRSSKTVEWNKYTIQQLVYVLETTTKHVSMLEKTHIHE